MYSARQLFVGQCVMVLHAYFLACVLLFFCLFTLCVIYPSSCNLCLSWVYTCRCVLLFFVGLSGSVSLISLCSILTSSCVSKSSSSLSSYLTFHSSHSCLVPGIHLVIFLYIVWYRTFCDWSAHIWVVLSPCSCVSLCLFMFKSIYPPSVAAVSFSFVAYTFFTSPYHIRISHICRYGFCALHVAC